MVGRPIDLSFERMTIRALDRRRLFLMRNLTDVRVAGSTEVLAVDGPGILFGIDLIVAGETVFVPDLLRSAERTRTKNRGCQQANEKDRGQDEKRISSMENPENMPRSAIGIEKNWYHPTSPVWHS